MAKAFSNRGPSRNKAKTSKRCAQCEIFKSLWPTIFDTTHIQYIVLLRQVLLAKTKALAVGYTCVGIFAAVKLDSKITVRRANLYGNNGPETLSDVPCAVAAGTASGKHGNIVHSHCNIGVSWNATAGQAEYEWRREQEYVPTWRILGLEQSALDAHPSVARPGPFFYKRPEPWLWQAVLGPVVIAGIALDVM